MADYDLAAIALASPPAAAPVTTYRPAVTVANLGIHPATCTGTLRIYDKATGLLVETHALTSGTIAAGSSGPCTSPTYWTPVAADIGKKFLFIASIAYPLDQNPANNNLPPTTVEVIAGEPPPPQEVPDHAAQHEAGGGDVIDLANLSGQLADPQTPIGHHASHEPGGADEVTVAVPGAHAPSHEVGGTDQMSVAALHGLLADHQHPLGHGSDHQEAGDDPIADAQYTSEKGAANGYAGLGANALVPINQLASNIPGTDSFLKADQTYQPCEIPEHKGAANGYAPLDANALVPSANLAPDPPPPGFEAFLRSDQTWFMPPTLVHGSDVHDSTVFRHYPADTDSADSVPLPAATDNIPLLSLSADYPPGHDHARAECSFSLHWEGIAAIIDLDFWVRITNNTLSYDSRPLKVFLDSTSVGPTGTLPVYIWFDHNVMNPITATDAIIYANNRSLVDLSALEVSAFLWHDRS